jgi:hypothetical protein
MLVYYVVLCQTILRHNLISVKTRSHPLDPAPLVFLAAAVGWVTEAIVIISLDIQTTHLSIAPHNLLAQHLLAEQTIMHPPHHQLGIGTEGRCWGLQKGRCSIPADMYKTTTATAIPYPLMLPA